MSHPPSSHATSLFHLQIPPPSTQPKQTHLLLHPPRWISSKTYRRTLLRLSKTLTRWRRFPKKPILTASLPDTTARRRSRILRCSWRPRDVLMGWARAISRNSCKMKFKADTIADAEIFVSGKRDDRDVFLVLYYQDPEKVLDYKKQGFDFVNRLLEYHANLLNKREITPEVEAEHVALY